MEPRAFQIFSSLLAAALHVDVDAKTGAMELPDDQVDLHQLARLAFRAVRAFDEVADEQSKEAN